MSLNFETDSIDLNGLELSDDEALDLDQIELSNLSILSQNSKRKSKSQVRLNN